MGLLASKQSKDGSVSGALTSITRSGGTSLLIETTSLTVLAWLNNDKYSGNVEKAIQYIVSNCQSGMFFSTQGTILALKAIILYDQQRSKPAVPGSIDIYVNNRNINSTVYFDEDTRGIIELPDFSSALKSGTNDIRLVMNKGIDMPFSMEYSYYSTVPASSPESKVRISTELSKNAVMEGNSVDLNVRINNISDSDIPTPIAIIGIPGGLELRYDFLKELQAQGKIDFFEINGQELVLYWRAFAPNEALDLSISCIASLPGRFTGTASRVYEYYTSEYKDWTGGVSITINH